MRKNNETIIFLHIPKAAGSTLNYLLEQQFPPEKTYATSTTWHHQEGSLEGFRNLPAEEKEKLSLVNGHMGFGLHGGFSRPVHYITLLREPLARTLSHYHFEGQCPDSPLYPIIQSGRMDLFEYLKYYETYECDNLQTRMISGNWDKRGYGQCDDEMLARAINNLQEHFSVVGLAERFDESYLLMRRTFGWRFAFTRRHNVSPKRVQPADLSPQEQKWLFDHNQFDMKLYQFTRQYFAEQLQRQGLSYRIELAGYRAMRSWRHHLEDWYWTGRKYSLRVFVREKFRALTHHV